MEILNRTYYHLQLSVDGGEVINTEFQNGNGYPPTKYFVTYFEGSGTLQVSSDGGSWLETNISGSSLVNIDSSLPQYFRISTSGTKTVFLTTV